MSLHPNFPSSPYAELLPDERWFPADETLRASAYFLGDAFGATPTGKTTDSKTDLGEIIREVEELAVFNDEAHHIHDSRLAWFKCIEDIHHRMLQKDCRLTLQVDVTATPRHNNGAIFVQTVSDYPLVEAVHQNVVKHPVLPDAPSRAKLKEHKSSIFTEILPEQTLGRGLRRMYFGSDQRETVSVMGTPAFMDFVESIQRRCHLRACADG